MTSVRRFRCADLLRFNGVNLDPLTETYQMSFYQQYFARWPELCVLGESSTGEVMGYLLGKVEGRGENWHGHVTALTVAPQYRRLGLAQNLMAYLEQVSEQRKCYFADLFVRASNLVAIEMYKKLGYSIYRRVIGYYSGEEDAFDMRKALSLDMDRKSIIPLDRPVYPHEVDQ
jgi:N-terminal acetyltransferase B complex catalytic subunit